MKSWSHEASLLVCLADLGMDDGTVRGPVCDRARIQLPDPRLLRRCGRTLDPRELPTALRSALSDNPAAFLCHGICRDRAMSGLRFPGRPVHLAIVQAQEPVSAAGDAPILDELPGPYLRVVVRAARCRPGKRRAREDRNYS